MNAPVVLSILNPVTGKFQRVLMRVKAVGVEISATHVENTGTTDKNSLLAGATFNIFVKCRSNPKTWVCVHLEISDPLPKAPCGDRARDHTLTKRMLCQLS